MPGERTDPRAGVVDLELAEESRAHEPIPTPEHGVHSASTPLLVRVQDALGGAWTEPLDVGLDQGIRLRVGRGMWTEQLQLVVLPVPAEAHEGMDALSQAERRLLPTIVEPGLFRFDVKQGRAYFVSLIGPTQPWDALRVQVPRSSEPIKVTRTVLEQPRGKLQLTWRAEGDVRLVLEDPDSGMPLMRKSLSRSPTEFELPVGAYRVAMEGEASVDDYHGELMKPAKHGRFERVVHVSRDEATVVEAELPAGARLRLRLQGEVRDTDRRSLQREFGVNVEGDSFAAAPKLSLVRDGYWPQAVHFAHGSKPLYLDRLALGTEATSELLPAGKFVLHARMYGGRTASAPVELVDGRTSTVTLSFE